MIKPRLNVQKLLTMIDVYIKQKIENDKLKKELDTLQKKYDVLKVSFDALVKLTGVIIDD